MKILSTFLLAGAIVTATPVTAPRVPADLLRNNAAAVAEPNTILLFAGGLFVAAGLARKKRSRDQSTTPAR
jgi:hypothetical protein